MTSERSISHAAVVAVIRTISPTRYACYPCRQNNIQHRFSLPEGSSYMLLNVLRSTYTITETKKKKKKKARIGIQYVWALLLRPCESHEQSIFSWQIMFTSKFKNTHPHLEEMPSRFLCDLSGHICGQSRLACGQPSFCCFISASVCRSNGSGPSAASSHTHKRMCSFRYAHTVYTHETCTLQTCLDFRANTVQSACNHAHNTHSLGLVKQYLAWRSFSSQHTFLPCHNSSEHWALSYNERSFSLTAQASSWWYLIRVYTCNIKLYISFMWLFIVSNH